MKKILPVLLLFPLSLLAQNNNKACEIFSKINNLIQREHYHPKPLDDSLSVYLFDSLLDRLDSNRNIFIKTEYEKLRRHRLRLDDYFLDNDCSFLKEFVSVYGDALERKKTVITNIYKVPFDYKSEDSIRFSKENFPFDLAESDLEKVWKKRLRFEILEEISKMSKNLDSLKQNFPAIEKDVRDKIFETTLCKTNTILNSKNGLQWSIQNDIFDIFCSYFDPHSNYFSVDAKSNFMSALSTSNLSLGLNLGLNDKEEIMVGEIIPGGPAAQSQKIEKGDVIVKVSNKGEEYWVSCASLEIIGDIIYSDSNREINITVRKKNGSVLDVNLKKEIMKANENSVYSFIAQKDARVGYIKIPNFYSDFETGNEGCAADVAKEIMKLQKDSIEGLVIDLQDNGGGSMDEAIKLAGMFIDKGPLSILSDGWNRKNIIHDLSRGSLYNGPLVVLMNGSSASASEFFAAAMQDYHRAFIIGSPSLGKASMQVIVPIDENDQDNFVKLTIQKFYRITGESGQIKGVIPDVRLPVLFDSLIPRESSYKTALIYDSIITKTKFQRLKTPNRNKIIEMSKQRVAKNSRFNELMALNTEINYRYNKQRNPVRLSLEDIFAEIHEIDDLWNSVKEITERPTNTIISNTSSEAEKIRSDGFEKQINDYKIKDVQNNPYLEEAITIINDFNTLKSKK